MADVKISGLPASTTPLAGTEVLPIVQSGITKQVSVSNLTDGRAISASSLALTTALPATSGGTGQDTYAIGDLIIGATANTLVKLPDVATGNALISGGVGVAPSYGKIGLTTHVSGTLPTANGGTGLTSFTNKGIPYATSTSALTTDATLTFDGVQLFAGGANNYSIKVARTDAFASSIQLNASLYQASFNWSNPSTAPFLFVDAHASATRASFTDSGFFCIGTTSASALFEVNNGNAVIGNADNNFSLTVSRITTLPSSIQVRALTYNSRIDYTYSGGVGMSFYDATDALVAAEFDDARNFRPGADDVYSLGTAALKWSVVYAGNGTINTSDANLKQQIEDLTSAEQAVAKAIKGLIKTFKFNSAVAKKGENARIHVGVIAQDVQAAFTAQGLDASKYGLFCSDTWWAYDNEKVEADENGVATLFVGYELDGEKLNISKYDTAPEGAVEIFETVQAKQVTQLGIRYEELLAFVISAL